jgi:exodeoxyribonuclease-3
MMSRHEAGLCCGVPDAAGYSATPLAKKLRLKAGMTVVTIDAPDAYLALLQRPQVHVPPQGSAGRAQEMKIATWNINGIRARLDYLMLWLAEHDPSVVCLQETKVEDAAFPIDQLEEAGYHVTNHGQKAYNGVAVLSRSPHSVVQVGLPGFDGAGARLLHVLVGTVHAISVYCPNGKHLQHDDYTMKLGWYDALTAYVRALGDVPRVVAGDFNIVPGALDSWSEDELEGGIFHTEAERSRLRELLDTGLQDVWREKNREDKSFSWWDYRAGAFRFNRGLRIDFVLAGGGLQDRVVDVMIDRDGRKKRDGLAASDHAPVLATFNIDAV